MSRRTYSSGSGGGGGDQKRRTFTKLMRDKNASVSSIHQASRFLEGMETFNSKAELLAQLQDPRNMGMHRIREVLSFVNSIRDVITLLIPLLGHIMTAETSRPIYRPLRDKLLLAIYNVPGLMLALEAHGVACDLDTESATCLCSFLRSLTKAILEPRQSELVLTMARNLRERGDVDEAGVLCTFLLVDGVDRAEMNARPIVSSKLNAAACWVTDMVPPGGRHDNDHRNFRNIRILPTIDELTCTVKPYLPLASGENRFMDEPVSSLLDSNFRLLREDAVSTMKQTLSDDSARGTWTNARIVDLDVGNRGGGWLVSFVVQCDSRTEGNPTWKYSRALRHGAVVALCRNGVPVRMGTIVVREAEEPDKWLHSPMGPKIGVAFESLDFDACIEEMINNSGINAIVCDTTDDLLHTRRTDPRHAVLLGHLQIYDGQMTTYDLIEVSKSFFAYHPILKALQAKESIPLSNELLGSQKSKNVKPSYLPDNISLPNDPNFEGYECDLEMWSTDDVVQKTTLDKSQADALRHSLSSRVALIQGPPGTGKTFLGALVARTIRRNTDETILCVCYTNHALDQFLEHMLATGENRLVRIGGRSKSETLGGYNLRNLSRRNQDTEGFCQRRIKQVTAQLFDLKKYIESDIELLKAPVQWSQIRDFLLSDEPETFDFLQAPNMEDGFNIIGPNGKVIEDSFLWDCWRKGDPLPSWTMPHLDVVDIREFNRFWNLSLEDRAIRIQRWKGEIMGPTAFEIAAFVEQFNALAQEMQSLRQDGELEILMSARVIGATTSGAANYRDLLALTAPGVVIVEEAGEVLEAHILTSLSESTQNSEASKHLIMIGDHKQLPPKVEQHALSTASGGGYNLDCSLFERLIVAGLPSVTLEVQHRMRPSISALIRAQTYPSLVDHDSVRRYPDLQGVSKNVVFVDHQQPEDGADTEESRTKSNQFEAELSLEIVRYFMLQGYRADQIVVLTPYVGQLVKLISLMKTNLKEVTAFVSERDAADLEQIEGADQVDLDNTGSRPAKCVRCSSIDNFQGEEADIIVISLVRSNSRGDIGFLKEKQRVNVLLSRARLGLFLVGNSSTLMNKMAGRHVWGPILQSFTSDGCLLKGLPSTCQLHPDDEPVQLCNAREFRAIRPNGGCDRSCNFRLPCGHACPLFCHPTDRCHERAQKSCCEPCKRFPVDCPLQHPCLKLCKDECGPCCAAVGSTQLLCGHSLEDVKCYETGKENAMFHLLLRCKAPKMHTFQSCGHDCETTCVNSRRDKPHCPAKCGKPANCEHPCTNICGSCDGEHSCNEQCSRILFCGHSCGRQCHVPQECRPCGEPCVVRCSHSACPKACSSPCASCVEPCDWFCKHQLRCPLVCGAPCARLPCNERCEERLSCGHRCPSLCGENCPDASFCRECSLTRRQQVVDLITFAKYEDHDVDEEPIIVLPCKHFFTTSTLDGHLEIDRVYETDELGKPLKGLKPLSGIDVSEKPKQCPECRCVIHSVRRYGRVLRLAELRSLERKHMMMVNQALLILSKRVERTWDDRTVNKLRELEREIRKSPMRRVFEACRGAVAMDTSPPPSAPLIRCIELQGIVFCARISAYNDDNFQKARATYEEAIAIADASFSSRSGAQLRIALGSLIAKFCDDVNRAQAMVFPLLDWVIDHHVQFQDLVDCSNALKVKLTKEYKINELRQILESVSSIGGYDYGGSASSHWFECRNGHPYYIGECGRAMEKSRCIECNEPVGGSSHTLLSSNRGVTGVVRDALAGL